MRIAAIVLVALVMPVAALAADPAPLPPASQPKGEVEKMREKVVCTKSVPVGSLIPVRRCTTKSAADLERQNAERMLGQPIPGNGSN